MPTKASGETVLPGLTVADIGMNQTGQMTHVTLSNGQRLNGIYGGSVRGMGKNALLFLTIKCTPTVNGQDPTLAVSPIVDARGGKLIAFPNKEPNTDTP